MLSKVRDYIANHQLLNHSRTYLVALSGGADSVCLLHVLLRLSYHVEAVHCNFHLRGEESNRDEAFVRQLCQEHQVPLHLAHFDTREYAQLHKVSIEMAARQLRYRYFEQLRNDIGAEAICVAHHRDDSIETILLNLVRGTGIRGLTGIKPRNGNIIRPLLCVSRQEIEKYLKDENQSYVTDSTNLNADEAIRNKIRLQILPLLREINPSVSESIQRTAERLSEVEKVVNNVLEEQTESDELSLQNIKQFPSPEILLFKLLTPYGFTPTVIEQLSQNLDAPSGRLYQSSTHELVIDRERLIIEPRQQQLPTLRIPEPGTYVFGQTSSMKFSFNIVNGHQLTRNNNCACLDANKVRFPLIIRPTQTGDRFVPFGMHGSRLVSDFLTDLKLTIFEKRRQLVVTDASSNIVWLVGLRPDNRFCLTDKTKETLLINCS